MHTEHSNQAKWVGLLLALGLVAGPATRCLGEEPGAQAAADLQQEPAEVIELDVGRSTLVEAPWRVSRVSVAAPEVANVEVISPRQVMLLAESTGTTDFMVWGEEQGQVFRAVIKVRRNLKRLRDRLSDLFPGSELELTRSEEGTLIVRGRLRRAEHARKLHEYLDATGQKYVDMTGLAGVQQVMLKVRLAEASRRALRSLGVNAFGTGDDFFGGNTVGGNPNSIDIGVPEGAAAGTGLPFSFNSDTSVGNAVTLFGGFPSADVQFFLRALEESQYMRTLAEPTLVAASGEEASFLAGGEFPVPIVQGTGGEGSTSITIEFKEFGVRLRFRPTVLGDNSINLAVAPEVSSISDVGSVQIEGFSIPAITTRRAETTVEMSDGETFAMAGLIDERTRAATSEVPGLGRLPVLGPLFRSVRYEKEETELVVLVTASLVEPLADAEDRPVPGELHTAPGDWELYYEGKIHGRVPKPGAAHQRWLDETGLHRLKGPGAWARHETDAAPPVRRGSGN